MADVTLTEPAAARLDLALDRLQLWMAGVAALLICLTLGAVLGGRLAGDVAPGWLLALPRLLAAGAVLTGQVGALAGYYATWRVLRGQAEYEAASDLKKEALTAPSHVSVAGSRAGCRAGCRVGCRQWGALGVFGLAVVLFAVLALLGYPGGQTAQAGGSAPGGTGTDTGTVSTPAIPRPTPTRSIPTPTPTRVATSTVDSAPPLVVPAPTPTPHVVFHVSSAPTAQDCLTLNDPLPPVTVTLDNTGSNIVVGWQVTIQESIYTGVKWAAASASAGSVPAGQVATLSLMPTSGPSGVCHTVYGATYHAIIQLTSGGTGTYTVADTITPYPYLR
jgi:hypothetical protein